MRTTTPWAQTGSESADAREALVLVRRVPFFYGWVLVAAAVASAGFMVGTSISSIAVDADPMHDELG